MTGVSGQDLTANPLRLGRLPRALMAEGCAKPSLDRRRLAPRLAPLLPRPGFGAPLLPVHPGLIAQLDEAYPPLWNKLAPWRIVWLRPPMGASNKGVPQWPGSPPAPAKMVAVGERLVGDHGGLRRATGVGSSRGLGTAGPVGRGPGLVLPPLGTLRESQPCPDRHERQLCRGCRQRQRILPRRFARGIITSRLRVGAGTSTRTRMSNSFPASRSTLRSSLWNLGR